MSTGLHASWAALNMRSGISGAGLWPTQHSFALFHHFPELPHVSQCLEPWALIILPSEVKETQADIS